METSPKDYSTRETLSGYLQDSGFSGGKRSMMMMTIVLGWTLGVIIIILWLTLMNELSPMTNGFGDQLGLAATGAFFASLFILPAVFAQKHTKKSALKNRKLEPESRR